MIKRLLFWLALAAFCLLWCLAGTLWAEAQFKSKCEGMIERQLGQPRATLNYLSTLEWPTYGPKE